jgi:hypothetical protein
MPVGVGNAPIVFFLELVRRTWSRIPARPELLDELIAFVIRGQAQESSPLALGNNVGKVLIQPLIVRMRTVREIRLLSTASRLIFIKKVSLAMAAADGFSISI